MKIDAASRLQIAGIVTSLFACVLVRGQPITAPSLTGATKCAIAYRSPALNALIGDAEASLGGDDKRKVREAVELFTDLRRTDLLAKAFTSGTYADLRLEINALVRVLPTRDQVDFVLRTLGSEDSMFSRGKGSEPATIQDDTVLGYAVIVRNVCRDSGVTLAAESAAALRKDLIESSFRARLRAEIQTRATTRRSS